MKKTFRICIILDVLTAILILLPLLFFGFYIIISIFKPEETKFLIEGIYKTPYLPFLAIFTCIILALWSIFGNGVNSKLWEWLPPFVFFKKIGSFGRALIIFLLIIGTFVGMIGEFYDLLDPAF